jgi:hypothetical protein
MKPHSIKKAARPGNWDALFKATTSLVAVAGLVFGVYQYRANTDRAEKEKAKEAAQALRDKQVELYLKASAVASEFAQESEPVTAEQKKKEFWGLFGEINVVENTPVTEAMKKFGEAIKDWDRVNNPPDYFLPPRKFDRGGTTFEQLAEELSQAMRASLLKLNSNQPTAQQIQRRLRRAPTDQFAIAGKLQALMLGMRVVGERDVNQTDRFFFSAAVGPGDSRNR